jgi:hypothetical protein
MLPGEETHITYWRRRYRGAENRFHSEEEEVDQPEAE